jgi:hypothetical protein
MPIKSKGGEKYILDKSIERTCQHIGIISFGSIETLIRETLEDYSNWLNKKGYIDSDYYTEEPKAIGQYLKENNLK